MAQIFHPIRRMTQQDWHLVKKLAMEKFVKIKNRKKNRILTRQLTLIFLKIVIFVSELVWGEKNGKLYQW